MTSTWSKSKSRRQSKRRHKNSASKRSRGQTKAVLKSEKKKFNIHVPEGENLAESGTKSEAFEEDDQPLDEGTHKKQKLSSRSKDCNDELDNKTRLETSLYLL
ncbi:Uncharacterized protein Fot_28985 [Forsythia ovata]|uniref:Uncharacterized protein n=1 Tax=Forsythia ovata TaxID=205694 RepID=A0ABD1TQM2_9LAMI